MNSKKLMSGALAAAMSCSMVAFADTTATTIPVNALQSDLANASANLKNAAMTLTGFGIMEGNGDQFGPTDLLTRAQAAKIFVNATGNGRLNGSVNRFADINSNDWFSAYANIADQTGIMIGSNKNGKRYFVPNDNLTFAQVATMAVRALGYKPADLEGDTWPYNYMAKAMELGIFDNVENDIDANQKVTRGDMALVVDKTLNTEVKPISTTATPKKLIDKVSGRFVKTVDGKKVAVSMSAVKGIVTGTAASNPALKANEVMIGAVKYTVPAADLLAKLTLKSTIEGYADASNSIISVTNVTAGATIERKDVVIDSKAPDTTGTAAWYVYYKDASVTPALVNKEIAINPEATVYFNGQKETDAKAAIGKIKAGAKVTLIENTKPVDGSADLKPGYDTVVVNYSEKFIATADAAVDATDFAQRSLKKADGTLGTITFTGAATKLSEIKKNDVVYVTATTDNAVVNMEVVRKTVTGKITSMTADGLKVTIGGVQYNVAGAPGLTVNNDAATVYFLDKDGAIADSTIATTVSELPNGDANAVYGYVSGAQWTQDAWTGVYSGKVKFTKLDGTVQELSTGNVNDTALLNKSAYYKNNGDGTATVTALTTGTVAFNANKISANTMFIEQDPTDGTKILSRTADIDVTKITGNVLVTLDRNNGFGDYYLVVVDKNSIVKPVSSTTFGYVAGKVEEKVVTKKDGTTVLAAVYNVFDNGVAKQVMYAIDSNKVVAVANAIQTGNAFSALTVDADGILTAVTPATITIDSNKLTAIDATRVCFNGVIYSIDTTNVKVYNKKDGSYKVAALSDVVKYDATNDATTKVDIVFDKVDGSGNPLADSKVIMMVVNR